MLEWLLSSTVLIAIVIVLRLIFKGKMSLRLQYALWAIVLLRLLVPFSFGSAGMSVQNVVAHAAAQTPVSIDWEKYEIAAPVEYDPDLFPTKEELDKYSLEDLAKMYGYDEIRRGEVRSDVPSKSTVREARHLTVNEILNIVWTCGAGLIALWLLVTNLRFYFKLRKSRERLEVDGAPLPVYVTDQIDTPCLFGLIKPKIYVTPDAAADETVLRYSVEHEATHRRHGDHIWSLLRGLCLALHWFNPLVWIAAVLSRNDAELACDEATIRRIGEEHRADYGRTLLQLTCEKRPALFVAATTMTGSGRTIKERIKLIVKKPKTAIITLIAIVLVIAIAVGCTFTGAKINDNSSASAETETTNLPKAEQDLPADANVIGQAVYGGLLYDVPDVTTGIAFEEDQEFTEAVLIPSAETPKQSLECNVPGRTASFTVCNGWLILIVDGMQYDLANKQKIVVTTTPIQHIKKLELSDLPAIFDAIDLNEATLTYYTGFSTAYPAAAANSSEQYFETLKQIPWQACNMGGFDIDDFNGNYIQLVVPHTTARLYEVGLSGENLLYVETDDAEGWFQPSPGTNAFNQALDWFTEVHGTSLWDGNVRILSEEELESFRAFTSSTYETYDAQGNLTTAFPTEISCFFTSYYSNVRDMDAYSFLWYFPSRSEDRTVDEAEWQLVQQVQDWRRGEDDHLMTMEELGVPIHRIPRARVNEVLMKYAGVTVEDMNTNWFEEMTYVPATDCFYVYTSDAGCGTFTPWFGVEHGDLVSFWAHNAYGPCRLDLIKDGDGWHILDHVLESCPPLGFKEEIADWERTFLAGRLEYYGYGSENAQFDVLYNKADRATYLFGATDRGYVIYIRYSFNFCECGDGNPYESYMDAQKYYVGMTYGVLLPEGYYNLTTQQFEEK